MSSTTENTPSPNSDTDSTRNENSGKSNPSDSTNSPKSDSNEKTSDLIGKDLYEQNFIDAFERVPTKTEDTTSSDHSSSKSSGESSSSTNSSGDIEPPNKRMKHDDASTSHQTKDTALSK